MKRFTFAQRFLIGSLVILLIGMTGIGVWVSRQIEDGVIHRTAATNALYVDSLVTSPLQDLAEGPNLSQESVDRLDWLLTGTPLGQQVALFRIWDLDGRIVYSSLPAQVGEQIPFEGEMRDALRGDVVAGIGEIEGDTAGLAAADSDLLEIYSPVRLRGSNEIIAIAEFYFIADDLKHDIAEAQSRSWLVVGGMMAGVYLLLAFFVQRVSNTITRQQRALAGQVGRLTELLRQNDELSERVRKAAARTTSLNERFLRRFSADLHDGPAQEISLALLRLDHVQARFAAEEETGQPGNGAENDLHVVQESLRRALNDVRATSAGLLLPELEVMTIAGTIEHAVRSHRRRSGVDVVIELDHLPEQAPLATKIAAYRVIQEALENAARHAGGTDEQVRASVSDGWLTVEIADRGPGFDPAQAGRSEAHLGLLGMRERVESLGGKLAVNSQPGAGTSVVARLPMVVIGEGND